MSNPNPDLRLERVDGVYLDPNVDAAAQAYIAAMHHRDERIKELEAEVARLRKVLCLTQHHIDNVVDPNQPWRAMCSKAIDKVLEESSGSPPGAEPTRSVALEYVNQQVAEELRGLMSAFNVPQEEQDALLLAQRGQAASSP